MDFNQVINNIELLKNVPLKGIEAHKELAPFSRPTFTEYQIPENAKKAGVLMLLYPDANNNTNILLTKRASYKGTHSSQISFPGGKKENFDINLQETALRETFEEVGIAKNEITVLKQLTTIYIPPSNFSVNPYIGILKKTPNFTINHEVDQIIHFPLNNLLDPKKIATFKSSTSYAKNIEIPCFVYNHYRIWGATAMILNEAKEVLKTL
ncbi:8-oxo-dGTP pyrophosphatase MutT (NUDIX family) [Wenyingzhuangia heitensis]|uniref:8-oxo-dGTP pyrophosphatase MutT (NUDIX family) n=1 Tax=Wenyingzhuangia heitensis TaxID=1487859 RepID=A0ABX0UDT7_9FLAO|nr:CoA pyrophosphatase [Wenyingzhuangia heitensis]NIJ45346.1 8-oxo-dGTP pyrophosphatase MutT (NUDIX family) [Wenyingzhuangia heitensis]